MRKLKTVVQLKSENVKEILMKRNRTHHWFARQLGVKRQYVSMLLAHVRNPSPIMRFKIQSALKGAAWEELFIVKR